MVFLYSPILYSKILEEQTELEHLQKKESYKQLFSQSNIIERPFDTISWNVFKTKYYSLDSSLKKQVHELQTKIFDFTKSIRFSINRVIEIDREFKRIDAKLDKVRLNSKNCLKLRFSKILKKYGLTRKKRKHKELCLKTTKKVN